MRSRRILAMAAAAVTVGLIASGCSAGSDENSAKQSMTVALGARPANLDFTTTPGAAIPQALMTNVYQGLVAIGRHGEVRPELAKSWTLSKDRTRYDFHLHRGVTFSSGARFTAKDVKFSIDRVKSKAWTVARAHKMDVVKKVKVVSPTTVSVTLKRPSNGWLFDMGTSVGAMFSRSGTGDLKNSAIGTGPYSLAKWNRGRSIVLKRRSDYWGTKPKLKAVTLKYFSDPTAATNALQSGDVDIVGALQAPDLAAKFADDEKNFQLIDGTTTGEVVLSLNNKRPPFNTRKARKAIMYGIDRKAVLDSAMAGYGRVTGGMAAPTDPYFQDLTGVYPYNQAKAKKLAAQAGIQGQKIHFTVPNLAYATSIAQVVTAQLKEIGVNAQIDTQEFPAVWTDKTFAEHDYQMSVINHAEPRDMLTMFNDPSYYIGYDNSKIKKVAARADSAPPAQYARDMRKVARTITDDAASDFLFMFPNLIVAKAGITGLEKNDVADSFDVTRLAWS